MFSEPAVGETFFGRQEVLDLLNKRVVALKDGYRQNVALTGQSLSGKSSIIHHFLYTLNEEEFISVYVEVVKEPFESFANKFIATLLYNALEKLGEHVDIHIDDICEAAEKRLPKTYAAIKQLKSSIERGQFDDAYSSLLGLTSVLKDEIRFACVVILDEFDNLEYLGVKNPFLNFGKVIMVQKDTMYIVSSSRNQAIKKILSEKLSLLFGNFEIVKVGGFDMKTASDFLDMKIAGYEMDLAMKKFLIAFTDGNAFYLDKIAGGARRIAEEGMSNYIGREAIGGAIVDVVYNSVGVIHQYIFSYMLELLDTKYKEDRISILTAIASGRRKQTEVSRSLKAKRGEVSKHLAHLTDLGFLSQSGVFYKIDDPMLEFWLKFVYQRRKEILVDGAFDRRRLFMADILSYIDCFARESERNAASRLAELFDLFSNETVRIDSKLIRLPHFTKVDLKNFPDGRQFIAASFRGKFWIAQYYENEVGENDIIDYVNGVKALSSRVSNKVIMPLGGIDENAKLLAKELKISIWDQSVVNMLLVLYGKKRIVPL